MLNYLCQLVISYTQSNTPHLQFNTISDKQVLSCCSRRPNYLSPLADTVFFAACCGLTHSVVCTSNIVDGNTRQCLLYVLICCVLQKQISSSLAKTSRSYRLCLGVYILVGLRFYNLLGPACLL